MAGLRCWGEGPVDVRAVPHPAVTLVLEFGDGPLVVDSGRGQRGNLVARLAFGGVRVRGENVECVQVRLSPVVAHAVLGAGSAEPGDTVVALDDLWGRDAARIRERLGEASSWQDRFDVVNAVLAGRREAGPAVDPEVAWVWDRIAASRGRTRVEELAVEELLTAAGEIDVLVANAALPATGLLADYSIGEIDRALDVNLRAPIVMAKLVAESMTARGRGHLVFISSLSGKTASGQASIYNATKFGMRGFALALREDMRPHNVGVSTVFPGFIRDAGMFADAGATLPRGVGTRSPQDVARATTGAIEKNLAEVDVAPPGLRLAALIGAAAIQRRFGGDKVTGQLAEGQRHKR